ncbi:phage major capsid protein [Candidatus Endomicrobiellum devescovinae]|jgi:hypothetical protein|uniref:phage major capsid protein n=1 Tax=Candidatus Endomicrobiellum devescovinae TaxID=3242322 RepID=UPI0028328FD0|nr:phage major capsid protein [Endomicrobium sp.]
MANYGYGAALFKDAWAATRSYYAKKVIEDIERSHPLLDKMAGQGNIAAKEGGVGKRNVELILARVNQNVRWVTFDEPITATRTSLLEQIEWDWKFCYQDFVLNDKVLSINKSDEIASLLEINQKALRQGFSRAMAEQLYAGGADSPKLRSGSGLEMGGLNYLLSENPYASDLYVLNLQRGGTPGDKYEFWRNRAGEWTIDASGVQFPSDANRVAQAEMLVNSMRNMVQTLNTSKNSIDGIYMNYKFYDLYIYFMQERLHINNVSGEKKDVGFSSVEFMGIPVYLDKYCPSNQIYFLNSSTLHFKYLEGENFKQEVRQIPDMFAHQYITTFIGNFIIERPRCNGVITLNTTTNGLPEDCNVCNFSAYHDYDYPNVQSGQTSDTVIEREDYSGSGVYREPVLLRDLKEKRGKTEVNKKDESNKSPHIIGERD